MRFPLRWRILIFTVLPIVTVVIATLWMVNRRVSDRVRGSIEDDLRRSSAVFENMLESRARELVIHGQVIAQDPRFFSVLTLPGGPEDAQVRATVSGVARDFNTITGADLFEVLDREGRLVASVGRASLDAGTRRPLLAPALAGRPISDVVVQGEAHYQVTLTPVIAGGRLLGVLVLGLRIGEELADRLRAFTRSEVTFRSASGLTVSTLESPADREALASALNALTTGQARAPRSGAVLEVHTPTDVYLTLWRALPQAQAEGRQSYVMQRSLHAETAFLREIQSGLIELGIVAVIVAMLAGFLIAERILAPVRRLVEGAEAMERGNYDLPLEVKSRDEIGYLAERFDEMRQQQRAYVSSLEEVTRIKSEFINIASHELRTPISIIRGFQELMSQGSLGTVHPRQAEALRAISRSTDTLARIAEDATRMTQIEGSRMTINSDEHAVEPLLQEAVETTLRSARDRKVSVTVEVERGVTSWRVDADRLIVALGHLVSNGIRFTPDGGRVSVWARREPGVLAIAVSDTGIGLPSPQQALGVDRSAAMRNSLQHHSSSTLEFNSRGLGLGLSIVRGIVDAHGGTLSVESEEGRGTTFTIRIPDAAESRERAA